MRYRDEVCGGEAMWGKTARRNQSGVWGCLFIRDAIPSTGEIHLGEGRSAQKGKGNLRSPGLFLFFPFHVLCDDSICSIRVGINDSDPLSQVRIGGCAKERSAK